MTRQQQINLARAKVAHRYQGEDDYPMAVRLWETSRWLSVEDGGCTFFVVPADEAEFLTGLRPSRHTP